MNEHLIGNLVGIVGIVLMVLIGVLLGEAMHFIKNRFSRQKPTAVEPFKSATIKGEHGGSVTLSRFE